MLDRLEPKKIIVVSSAPQIRYPDCYGIDMAKLEEFIAFRAALKLHEDRGTKEKIVKDVYQNCLNAIENELESPENYVKEIYKPFSDEEISFKISEILKTNDINAELRLFSKRLTVEKSLSQKSWRLVFFRDYPTPGGRRVVNKALLIL